MATLVTGGTGFVGSNVVRVLAEQGENVVCFDIAAPADSLKTYIAPWADKVTFIQGDLLKHDDLHKLADPNITRIVHAAVFTGVLPEIEASHTRSIVEINVMGTTNALELARQLEAQRFVYVSSAGVYGDYASDVPLTEESPLRPRTLYAVTKYTSELLTRRYKDLFGLSTVSVRLGTPFGPMERVTGHRANQSWIKELTGNILRGEPMYVGDPNATRTFTYVLDIARGISSVLNAPTLSFDVYNNSSEERRSVGDVIDLLREIEPSMRVTANGRAVLPRPDKFLISARMRDEIGFVPSYDLRTGLSEYLTWRRANNDAAS